MIGSEDGSSLTLNNRKLRYRITAPNCNKAKFFASGCAPCSIEPVDRRVELAEDPCALVYLNVTTPNSERSGKRERIDRSVRAGHEAPSVSTVGATRVISVARSSGLSTKLAQATRPPGRSPPGRRPVARLHRPNSAQVSSGRAIVRPPARGSLAPALQMSFSTRRQRLDRTI
jgi:hypothetical protein